MASPRLSVAHNFAPPSLRLKVIPEQNPPKTQFTAEFLERRMRQHKNLQAAMARQFGQQIVEEVRKMLAAQ